MPPIAAHALWAPTYDLLPNPLLSLEERTVGSLLPALRGLAVLDVACGTGRWLEKLAGSRPSALIGIDLSPEMLRQASRKTLISHRLVQAHCNELPLVSLSVDMAICSFCAGYLPDLGEFARELARVVRETGKVILSDFHPAALARGWKRSFRHEQDIIEVSNFDRPLEMTLAAFRDAGYTLEHCIESVFDAPDQAAFEQCGRGQLFHEVKGQTAIYAASFTRVNQRRAATAVPLSTHRPGTAACNGARNVLRLTGARVAVSAEKAVHAALTIADGCIRDVEFGQETTVASEHTTTIHLENYLILPGLINAHDHLDFSLFPRLGHGPYRNCETWARDIFHPGRSPVREHLAVPKQVRLWWGGLRNLLSGVTTVCHHNPYDVTFQDGFPIRVVERYGWAHSLSFDNNVRSAFAATEPGTPFMIHIGEGTDTPSGEEIFELDRMNALDNRTLLVHGVGFSEAGHSLWQERGAALVWCPTSNRFTLGATLNGEWVSSSSRTALGSDSPLTARGDLLDEIRAGHYEEGAPAVSLYRMVTETPAAILRLTDGEGTLKAGAVANLIAVPWQEQTPAQTLVRLDAGRIEMVMVRGQLHLASSGIAGRFSQQSLAELESLSIEGIERRVRAPVSWLISQTLPHLPRGISLAGKRISA
jgi:cytosine/adenosine deaminase-related metal-dependent hydrolase/ubiquinone/menaquinone biosynthesis C-methylase UbiE